MRTTTWRKSSRSGGGPGGQCVEVRLYEGTTMQVRDTKLANSPILDVVVF